MMDEYRKRHNIQTRLNSHFFDSVERAEKKMKTNKNKGMKHG